MWIKGDPSALLVGLQTGAITVENKSISSKNLKVELPFDPMIPTSGNTFYES